VAPPSELIISNGVFGSNSHPFDASKNLGVGGELEILGRRVCLVHVTPPLRVTM